LRGWRYPKGYFKLYQQARLASRLRLLPEPKDPNGEINAAAYTLCEMGEPARPAFAELARCLDESAMSLSERQEVMWQLIQAGPVAAGALPHLRRLARVADSTLAVQAALAIYNTQGSTNALASALRRHLAQPDSFGSVSRELWWFRGDDRVQNVVLPLICPLVGDQTRPIGEREDIVHYLRDARSSSPLPRTTLEAVLDPADESSFGEAVRRALQTSQHP
jgi:hypothetical protein